MRLNFALRWNDRVTEDIRRLATIVKQALQLFESFDVYPN